MEFIIIPQLILVISLFGILFVLGRNFSRFKDVCEEKEQDRSLEETVERIKKEEEKFKYLCRRLAKRINLRTAQEKHKRLSSAAHIKLEKILRKIRIGFLKLDSKFMVLIEKLRKRKKKDIGNMDETAARAPQPYGTMEPTEIEGKKDNGILGYSEIEEEEKEDDSEFAFGLHSPVGTMEPAKAAKDVSENPPYPPLKKGEVASPLLKKGKSKEGEYLEAISGDPKDTDAYWKLGTLYSRKRNYRDALNCFKEIVKIKPNYGKAKKKIKDISEKIKGR